MRKKIGILLVNLGTPDAPTAKAVRKYLREFLSDRRVIPLSPILWQPILNTFVLTTRPRKKAKDYQKIWTDAGSPLLVISQQLQQKLQMVLQQVYGDKIFVKLAMRYGKPSIAAALHEFKQKQIERICVLPLYPQYSAATTASTFDKLSLVLRQQQNIPAIHFIRSYHDFDVYIEAISKSIEEHWMKQERADLLLFSFHGLPQAFIDNGDPYQAQCLKTAQLIAETLKLDRSEWLVVFQSRFGPKQWLEPYTDVTLKNLPSKGSKNVDIICPGFAVDCLETLEEIQHANSACFHAAGGESLNYIAALNSSDLHVAMLSQLVQKHIAGWV